MFQFYTFLLNMFLLKVYVQYNIIYSIFYINVYYVINVCKRQKCASQTQLKTKILKRASTSSFVIQEKTLHKKFYRSIYYRMIVHSFHKLFANIILRFHLLNPKNRKWMERIGSEIRKKRDQILGFSSSLDLL